MSAESRVEITGKVVNGNKIGRKIGFPTANITIEDIPQITDGVYLVRVNVDGEWFWGVANLGYKPTFGGKSRVLEVHILNFAGDIYDRVLRVRLYDFIRGEVAFDSVEKLRIQIDADKQQAIKLINDVYRQNDSL